MICWFVGLCGWQQCSSENSQWNSTRAIKHRIPVDCLLKVGYTTGFIGNNRNPEWGCLWTNLYCIMAWDRLGEGSIWPMSHGSLELMVLVVVFPALTLPRLQGGSVKAPPICLRCSPNRGTLEPLVVPLRILESHPGKYLHWDTLHWETGRLQHPGFRFLLWRSEWWNL